MRILYNARIYTMDEMAPQATALAIENGVILIVGSDDAVLSEFERRKPGQEPVRLHNLDGKILIPGLTDAHMHLEHYALGLTRVDCETPTKQECLERVAERARNTPVGEWVLGHGWNQNVWAGGFGCAADLDVLCPEHPVYLTAKSLHAAWANSAALRLAGLSDHSADPDGGTLGRDADGNLNGLLFEKAMDLVARVLPEPTLEQTSQAIREAQKSLWRVGLTGVHDFDGRSCFQALQWLHQHDALQMRVIKSIPLDFLSEAAALGLRSGFGDDFLRLGSVKGFADGALGPQTAAMLQPFTGSENERGMLLMDAEELFERGRVAVDAGLSMAIHAIGDRAVHEMLEGYRQLRDYEIQCGLPVLRHRIEHVQLIHPNDAGRLALMGIVASMQPIHATSDMEIADRYWGERATYAYAWRTQLDHGAILVFGSDAPVESPNPFWGIHAAVTRRRADGSPGAEGWYPAQRLNVRQALKAYTVAPAYAAGVDHRLGRLAAGYLADLLVLDVDPFVCEAGQLKELLPLATMVNGEWVSGYS